MSAILKCEVCQEDIARFHPKEVFMPLTGAQFFPLAPNYPMPFPISVLWEDMRCPHCNYRPIIEPNRILTKAGKHIALKEFRL